MMERARAHQLTLSDGVSVQLLSIHVRTANWRRGASWKVWEKKERQQKMRSSVRRQGLLTTIAEKPVRV